MSYHLSNKFLSLGQSTHTSLINHPNFTLSGCNKPPTHNPLLLSFSSRSSFSTCSSPIFRVRCQNDDELMNKHSEVQHDFANTTLVGWWVGSPERGEYPYGQLIHISAERGRYLARSYSPWQLATAKIGTPLFEIYVTTGLNGEYKEEAIYIKREADCQDSLGSSQGLELQMCMFPLTAPSSKTNQDLWVETMMKLAAASGEDTDKETLKNLLAEYGMNEGVACDEATEAEVDSVEEKTVIYIVFAVGDIEEKVTGILNKKLVRAPAILEKKGFFSFCLTLEEDKDQHDSVEHSHEVYHATHHEILDLVDCIGRGVPRKEVLHEIDIDKFFLLLSRAKNQQPFLSRLTTFNRLGVAASSEPLNGLYIGSNGYVATEVIQIRHLFGPWNEVGGTKDVSELELCDYVEAVNLTGDSDMPAGQVAFRAKVGGKYKLPPGIDLEARYGAVARYRGEGRLTGFQNSEWVDVEVLILREEYGRDECAIGVLYSAPEYYFLRLFKQLKLQSFQDLNDPDS